MGLELFDLGVLEVYGLMVLGLFYVIFYFFFVNSGAKMSPKEPKMGSWSAPGCPKRRGTPQGPSFAFCTVFGGHFWSQSGPKTEPKSVPESSSKIVPSQVALGDALLQAQGGAGV